MTAVDPRVAIVNEHMRLENAYDFVGCTGVFGHAKYEIVADGELYDGAARVQDFLGQNHGAFPDFVFAPTRVAPTTDAVLVEGRFEGTHLGNWRGLPATGRRVDFAMCLIFEFEGESMVNEKVYFDLNTPLRQLGVADDPNSIRGKVDLVLTHPLVLIKALLRKLTHPSKK
ncbi:SnoaL-like polyketide cyclase [Frankineae bacterium MT45]|nr:SnoaL-like polyketide cyclase [Frankineae bacterium MT45]